MNEKKKRRPSSLHGIRNNIQRIDKLNTERPHPTVVHKRTITGTVSTKYLSYYAEQKNHAINKQITWFKKDNARQKLRLGWLRGKKQAKTGFNKSSKNHRGVAKSQFNRVTKTKKRLTTFFFNRAADHGRSR